MWTWIHGHNTTDVEPVHETKGIFSENATPGSRKFPTTWVSNNGSLWLMGGLRCK